MINFRYHLVSLTAVFLALLGGSWWLAERDKIVAIEEKPFVAGPVTDFELFDHLVG